MCMGRTHALGGALLYVAALPWLAHATPALTAIGGITAAGAGLLPDSDHPCATIAQTYGPLTKALTWLIGKISGGHRHGTHTLAGAVLLTWLTWFAVRFRHDLGGRIGLAVLLVILFASALRALRIGGILPEAAAFTGGVLVAWTGYGTAQLTAAVGIGIAAHLFLDSLTEEGCPLFSPFIHTDIRFLPQPFAIKTGHAAENLIVCPAVAGVLGWLAFTRAGYPVPLWVIAVFAVPFLGLGGHEAHHRHTGHSTFQPARRRHLRLVKDHPDEDIPPLGERSTA